MKLDLKDRKILYELDRNARQSNNEIAKRVGLNKNTVNYKIIRMQEEKIILGYYSVIDSSKLGYFSMRVYLKFFNTTESKEKEIIEWLNKNPQVGVLARIENIYDLVFMAWAKDIYEIEAFLNEFKKKFRKHFWNEKVHIFARVEHFKRKYLLDKKDNSEEETIGGREIVKYDELDMKILQILAKNSRTPLIEISDKLKKPPRTIAFRIKQLEKNKVIMGYRVNLNLEKLGYEYYKVNFILNDYSQYEALNEFCKINKNIIYVDHTIGEIDFEIDVEIENRKELIKLLGEIKSKFNIRDSEAFSYKEYIKLESIPQS